MITSSSKGAALLLLLGCASQYASAFSGILTKRAASAFKSRRVGGCNGRKLALLPAEQTPRRRQNPSALQVTLPNLAEGADRLFSQGPSAPPSLAGNEEALFIRAKEVLASDFGISNDNLLADDFFWIGPNLGAGTALSKQDYLAAGRFFDLRSTFPDLDYRAHDFRVDEGDPLTIRLTARTVGTMRGELRLRTETLPPNGKPMVCPPEAISMTFDDESGKLKKLCSGFCLDRLVGNTRGLCGVMAAAVIAGSPPSEWEIYPPTTVVSRFFGRSVKQLVDTNAYLAPFPETVMIQLAKGVIAADNGSADPDLLAPSFTFCGPIVGPVNKDDFVKAFGDFNIKEAFPDLDAKYSNFRVDPYDPYRVWVDAQSSGTRTGTMAGSPPTNLRYESAPEGASFTFDDDGFCTRLTGGYVLDPSLGNTGGLGGIYGVFYGTGTPLPGIVSRPLPQLVSRIQKRALQPFTGVGVDDYVAPATKPTVTEQLAATLPKVPTPPVEPPPPSTSPPKVVAKKEQPKKVQPKKVSPPPPPPRVVPKVAMKPVEVATGASQSESVANALKSILGTTTTSKPNVGDKKAAVPIAAQAAAKKKQEAAALQAKKKAEIAAEAKRKRDEQAAKVRELGRQERLRKEAQVANEKAARESQLANERAAREAQLAKEKATKGAQLAKEKATKEAQAKEKAAKLAEAKQKAVKEARARAEAAKEALAKEQAAKEALAKEKAAKEKAAREAKAKEIAAKLAEARQKAKASPRKLTVAVPKAPAIKAGGKPAKGKGAPPKKEASASPFGAFSNLGRGKAEDKPAPATPKVAAKKVKVVAKPPRGVPVFSKWRKNRDGSITGLISGSPAFDDGDEVTTSSIVSGSLEAGNVVQTESGSKYFLQ